MWICASLRESALARSLARWEEWTHGRSDVRRDMFGLFEAQSPEERRERSD